MRDFMDVLEIKGRKAALYRGQANSDWSLKPSVFRDGAHGISTSELLLQWTRSAYRFASPVPTDPMEWMILAQHYGIPTPLLDWTTSPLVGLYFACEDAAQKDNSGCVWHIMRSEFIEPQTTSGVNPFDGGRDKPYLIDAIGRNPRSTAQDSCLSIHFGKDYDGLVSEKIFSIESEEKLSTLQTLEKLGFSAERLHNDITKLVDKFKANIRGSHFPGWS